jgi:hypothetical protein
MGEGEILSFIYLLVGIALAISVLVMLIVAVGVGDQRPAKDTKIGSKIASTARHLNGEGAPPEGLVHFFEELPIPQSARSALSARSAVSASEKVHS